MNIEEHELMVSGLRVHLIRKSIKNLHLGVYPPDGHVRVAAPLTVSTEAVRRAVIEKLGWIKRQQAKFNQQERQPEREMVSGESHYFLGHRYRLQVIPAAGHSKIILPNRSFMELYVSPDSSAEYRRQILARWYRTQLKGLLNPIVDKWQHLLQVEVTAWGIKKMKTKWGSCNPDAGRIWINLELAKKSLQCIEYVVAHELLHLVERTHNSRFVTLLDLHIPQWRVYRQELNAAPLAYEIWESRLGATSMNK